MKPCLSKSCKRENSVIGVTGKKEAFGNANKGRWVSGIYGQWEQELRLAGLENGPLSNESPTGTTLMEDLCKDHR
jgi:hypothetical protein